MSLLGTPLLILLGCAAVLAPVATLFAWSRVRGPKPARVASRLALLGVCELTGVLLVAAIANDYGQFYSSWSDLFGTVRGHYRTTTYGARAAPRRPIRKVAVTHVPDLGSLQVRSVQNWSRPAQWRTRGKVIEVTVTGRYSHLRNTAYIYLPPEYFAAGNAHTKFPAVEVLTGYPGIAHALVTRLNYPAHALSVVQAHRARPALYVMLSSTVARPRDTECTNVPHGPQAETYLAAELPSAVERSFRVRPGDWGVIGDSTGGYCAAKLAMYQRNTFAAGVSLSGYYHTLSDWTTGNLWGGSLAAEHSNDLEWRLAHQPAPAADLYLTISKQEGGADGYADTVRFLHLVRPPLHVRAVVAADGGHNFRNWGRQLPDALVWLSSQLRRTG